MTAGASSPRHIVFDGPPEIFATDNGGNFWFPLTVGAKARLDTAAFDEVRLMLSVWHPSSQRSIDLDRAYVELRGGFDAADSHWFKLAEVEPVVPAYGASESFDGWIVLPVFSIHSAFGLAGGGFAPRARLQIRAHAYLVA